MSDQRPFWRESSDDESADRDLWQKQHAATDSNSTEARSQGAHPLRRVVRVAASVALCALALGVVLELRGSADLSSFGSRATELLVSRVPPQAAEQLVQAVQELSGAVRVAGASDATAYARLGIDLAEVNAEFLEFNSLPSGQGAVITQASSEGLAQTRSYEQTPAGLRPFPLGAGDVVLDVNGAVVFGKYAVQTAIIGQLGSNTLSLTVLRGGPKHQVRILLSATPSQEQTND